MNWSLRLSVCIIFIPLYDLYKLNEYYVLGAFFLKAEEILKKNFSSEKSLENEESPRMKQFHEKLKLQPIPSM